jgi:hypothetical protein
VFDHFGSETRRDREEVRDVSELREGKGLFEESEAKTYEHRVSMFCAIAWRRLGGWKVSQRGEVHPGRFVVHYQRFDGHDQP